MLSYFSYSEKDLALMPIRQKESHKGTFGKVLFVCGSVGMCGAAYLAAKACYRTGAGLVRILTVNENLPILQTLLPEAIVTPYASDPLEKNTVDSAVDWADVIVAGCGLGVSPSSRAVLSDVLRRRGEKPSVLDADALNLLSRNPSLLKYAKGAIITPHPLEMSRLCAISPDEILANTEQVAHDFAKKHELICAIKRHRTVVSDGSDKIYVNTSGNSGMATGGSGDVLAGIIGGILAQSRDHSPDAFTCASLGVFIHGLCGDLAAKEIGEYSLMASDIINTLGQVTSWCH